MQDGDREVMFGRVSGVTQNNNKNNMKNGNTSHS